MAFIGRERELVALGAALQRAAEGEAARIALSGPLGIGVSRLLDELAARVKALGGVTICRARNRPPTAGVAYGGLRDALAQALAAVPDERLANVLGPGAHDLVTVIPGLRARLDRLGTQVTAPALDAPDQRGARVRESLFAVVSRLAERAPVLLMVEDLEHSDPGTREFVSALLRVRGRVALALVVGYHTDEIHRNHPALPLMREINDSESVAKFDLRPFDAAQMAAFVEDVQGEKPTLSFVAAVMEGSRGNPLVAGQLVAANAQLDGLRLSDPFDEILQARLADLDPTAIRTLRVLAAARRPLALAELRALTLADGHLPRNAEGEAVQTGLAVRDENGVGIVHDLCAEAIEAALLPNERHEQHEALAEVPGLEPSEAAWHWERAGRPAEARAAHLAAADAARDVEPGATTLAHYVAALEVTDLTTEPDEIELLTAAAGAAGAARAFRRAAAYAEQAIRRVAGGRVEKLLVGSAATRGAGIAEARLAAARLCEQLGVFKRGAGDPVGAQQAFERAVELASADAPHIRAQAHAALAQELMLDGRFADSIDLAEKARATARLAGADGLPALAHATDTLAVDVGYMGDIDRALALLDEAMATARRIGRLDEVMRCYANKTALLDLDLRRDEALAQVKEGIAEASRGGLGLTFGAFLRGNAADILFQLGRWTEAEAECRAAMEFPPAGVAWFSPTLYLGLVAVESRADDEAARLVGQTLLQLETVPAGQWSAIVLRTAVSFALWRGELEDARSAAEQNWGRVLDTGDPAQAALAAAAVLEACAASAERGRLKRDWSEVAAAGELAARVLPAAEEQVRGWDLPKTIGARREADLYLATARAHASRVRGRTQPETWAVLAEEWAKVPVPYQVAKALWWQAQAALPTRSRRAEARRALNEAWRIASELPAAPLQRSVRDIAARGRITLPGTNVVAIPIESEPKQLVAVGPGRRPPADIGIRIAGTEPSLAESRFGLSPRENSVLFVLAEGRTNREIAERLFISERTVAVHVRRILAKLGVSGRTEATGLAIRLGLVPSEAPSLPARTARA